MADWFIARNGQQEGPLSEQAVRMFITSGQLQSEDVIWRQGMSDWIPAGRVTEFANLFQAATPSVAAPPSPQFTSPTPVTFAVQTGPGRNTVLTDRGLDMLRKTKPWARLLGVLILIGAGLMLIGGVLMIGIGLIGAAARYGSKTSDIVGVTVMGAMYLVFAVLYLMPGVYLNRYASRIGDLVKGGREDQLEQALEAQKSFWKFVGIAALLTIVLWIATIFIVIAASVLNENAVSQSPKPFPGAPVIPKPPSVPQR